MKTSTILIISAIAIVLISLTAYNFTLRASYLNGDYKNPFYGLNYAQFRNVSRLNIKSSNNIQFRIRQGTKQGIYLSERVKDKVLWSVEQNLLQIDLSDEAKKNGFMVYDDDLVLVLSKIDELTSSPYFKSKEDEANKWNSGKISLMGFRQDTLKVDVGRATSLTLDSLRIGTLSAMIGKTGNSLSKLSINAGYYQKATFHIPGTSTLELLNPQIIKTEYHVSSGTTVTLNGSPLNSIHPITK